jgi:hypothetical protein
MTDPISSTVKPQFGRPTDIRYDTWMGGNQPAYTGRRPTLVVHVEM